MIIGTFSFFNEKDLILMQIETLLTFCDKIICYGDNPETETYSIAETFKQKGVFDLYSTYKKDQINERDEWGDRDFLLNKCKEDNAALCFHTDVDEIIKLSDLNKVKHIVSILRLQPNHACRFNKYNLWESGYRYRLDRTGQYAGQEITNIKHNEENFIFPVKKNYYYSLSRSIPNYHCPRFPINIDVPTIKYDIDIIHYGYYRKLDTERKGKFYKSAGNFADNCWGKDMQMSLEEYKDTYGVGFLKR